MLRTLKPFGRTLRRRFMLVRIASIGVTTFINLAQIPFAVYFPGLHVL